MHRFATATGFDFTDCPAVICVGAAVGEVCALSCQGLKDSEIEDITFDNVHI